MFYKNPNFQMNLLNNLRMMRCKSLLYNMSNHRCSFFCTKASDIITIKNMNQNIINMEYAVRGPLLVRATEIEKELASGKKKPFDQVIKANLGDCHALGQPPITFFRQVLALVCYPHLMSKVDFPSDTKARAKELLSVCRGGSVGAYTESFGIELIRKHVAESIKRRDNVDSKFEDVMLSAGASEGIKNVLKLINQPLNGKSPGVMIPIPQYPLYSASLTEFGMHLIGYYLKEENNWSLDEEELQRSYDEAKDKCNPRAIVVINPGNPTGQVLTKKNIEQIIKFAYSKKLLILADEVYQHNIYAKGSEFHSFKKVANELGNPYNKMELASFMSCSKGFMGECGIRGGYCEFINLNPDVKVHFSKCISTMLCPTAVGQCLLDCIVKPPERGEASYDLFVQERDEILNDLKQKAQMVHKFFNTAEGFSCNEVQGAMYAFPKIEMPPKVIQIAKEKNMPPDQFYAFELLNNTGICVVPGSGFKQKPGTYHFRTTILPRMNYLKIMLETFELFHKDFIKKYS